MKVFGELDTAFLENDPSGSKEQRGRVTGGDNVASEVDALLTDIPVAYVGNGTVADRLASAREVQSVYQRLTYVMSGVAVARYSRGIAPLTSSIDYDSATTSINTTTGLATLTSDVGAYFTYILDSSQLFVTTLSDGTYSVSVDAKAGIGAPFAQTPFSIVSHSDFEAVGEYFDSTIPSITDAIVGIGGLSTVNIPTPTTDTGLAALNCRLSLDGGVSSEAYTTGSSAPLYATVQTSDLGNSADSTQRPLLTYTLVSGVVTGAEVIYPADTSLNVSITQAEIEAGNLQITLEAIPFKNDTGTVYIPVNHMFGILVDVVALIEV